MSEVKSVPRARYFFERVDDTAGGQEEAGYVPAMSPTRRAREGKPREANPGSPYAISKDHAMEHMKLGERTARRMQDPEGARRTSGRTNSPVKLANEPLRAAFPARTLRRPIFTYPLTVACRGRVHVIRGLRSGARPRWRWQEGGTGWLRDMAGLNPQSPVSGMRWNSAAGFPSPVPFSPAAHPGRILVPQEQKLVAPAQQGSSVPSTGRMGGFPEEVPACSGVGDHHTSQGTREGACRF